MPHLRGNAGSGRHRGKIYTSVQVCESYRDPAKGNSPRSRVLINLGPQDKIGVEALRSLANGFARAAGVPAIAEDPTGSLITAPGFGHVHAVGGVWDLLGLSRVLDRAGVNGEATFSPAELIRMLVVNRICEPGSKLALLDWLDSVHYGDEKKPSYHHLLRAMDHLIESKEKAEPLIAKKLLPPGEPLDLVFYDITSTYFEGDRSPVDDDFRRYGYSRDGRFDKRQVVIGMVMTPEGIPLCHHAFPGNTVDKTTVVEVVKDLKTRAVSRPTAEQKALLAALGVPPVPATLSKTCLQCKNGKPQNANLLILKRLCENRCQSSGVTGRSGRGSEADQPLRILPHEAVEHPAEFKKLVTGCPPVQHNQDFLVRRPPDLVAQRDPID